MLSTLYTSNSFNYFTSRAYIDGLLPEYNSEDRHSIPLLRGPNEDSSPPPPPSKTLAALCPLWPPHILRQLWASAVRTFPGRETFFKDGPNELQENSSTTELPRICVDRPGKSPSTLDPTCLYQKHVANTHVGIGEDESGSGSGPGSTNAEEPGSCFLRLPNELMLQIMSFLEPAALYCFRQSSPRFMALFGCQQFREFHAQHSGSTDTWFTRFRLSRLSKSDKHAFSIKIQRHLYCTSCLEADELGRLSSRLAELSDVRYCDGCREMHAAALFFQDDITRHITDGTPLVCIGRLGQVAACEQHPGTVIDWGAAFPPRHFWPNMVHMICTDVSHQLRGLDRPPKCDLSEFPRLVAHTP